MSAVFCLRQRNIKDTRHRGRAFCNGPEDHIEMYDTAIREQHHLLDTPLLVNDLDHMCYWHLGKRFVPTLMDEE